MSSRVCRRQITKRNSQLIIIETTAAPVLEHLGEAVLDLVAENVTDLAMAHPSPSHPLFSVYRLVLLTEVRAYLARPVPSQMELVTAVEDGKLLGFVLCGLSPSRECGIYYTAVTRLRRNEGVMSLMIRDVLTRYSAVRRQANFAGMAISLVCSGL